MATGTARLAAAAVGCALLFGSRADASTPSRTASEASAGKATRGKPSPLLTGRGHRLPSPQSALGLATRDSSRAGREPWHDGSGDLRVLRAADAELFPGELAGMGETGGPTSPKPRDAAVPEVTASGLPPEVSLPSPDAAGQPWPGPPLQMPDLPVRWDARVIRYLQFFRDDPVGRSTFADLYRRSGRWREMMRSALRSRGLPEDLVWVAMIESGFDVTARSRAGAAGLWQLMPRTARLYGLTVDRWIDQRLSPTASTQVAAALLDDLHRRFGSWDLALAGYSMGCAGLWSAVRRYDNNDFWSLARAEGSLPWETALYVPKVLAAAIVARNLDAFGFADVRVDRPVPADVLDVSAGAPLALVARAVGCSLKTIEDLNPELRAARVPPADSPQQDPYPVRVPQGTANDGAQTLERMLRGRPPLVGYVVRFGETLDQVALLHHTTARRLVDLNGLATGEVVRGGTRLLVPAGRDAPLPPTSQGSDKPIVIVPSLAFVYPDRDRVFYCVASGDTLAQIAGALGVAEDELRRWNELDPSARLEEGMTLQAFVPIGSRLSGVRVAREHDVHAVAVGSDEFFTLIGRQEGFVRKLVRARSGDTMASVGRRFGISARTMERVNHRSRKDALAVGEPVVLYLPRSRPGPVGRSAAATERAGALDPLPPPAVPGGSPTEAP